VQVFFDIFLWGHAKKEDYHYWKLKLIFAGKTWTVFSKDLK